MDLTRKNRYHSTQDFQHEEEVPNYLSAFLRSSRSPSYLEVKAAQSRPVERTVVGDGGREYKEIQQLRGHYECIEKVLNDENVNLKMQAKYLVSQMRKSLRREKNQKEQLAHVNAFYQRSRRQLEQLEQENGEMREFVESKIIFLLNSLKITKLHDLQEEVQRIIQQFCQYFNINLEVKQISKHERITAKPYSSPLEEQSQITSKIDQLNDKFQSLMSQYKSTSRPQIRKQCIDIAKQIKQLKTQKEGTNEGSRMEKTVQNLSRIHSNEYLSVKSKNSKNYFHFDDDHKESLQNTGEKAFSRNPSQAQNGFPSRKTTNNGKDRPSSYRNPI